MNYDIERTAGVMEAFLRERLRSGEEPEAPFRSVMRALLDRDDLDKTPEWVALAALGHLVARGRARVRVFTRDQERPDEVRVMAAGPDAPAGKDPSAPGSRFAEGPAGKDPADPTSGSTPADGTEPDS